MTTSNRQHEHLPADPTERRRFPRADLVFRVRYQTVEKGQAVVEADQPLAGQALGRDISLGGVSFRSNLAFPAGASLRLSFYFEEVLGEISAVGRVMRTWSANGDHIVAVRFTVIDPDDCSILTRYIREYEESHPSGGA